MIFMLALAPNMTFSGMPSGSVYVSNQYGIIVITNGSVPDQLALAAGGCKALSPINGAPGTPTIGFTTLAALYTQDATANYAVGTIASVFGDSTISYQGVWSKEGTGTGSGNWTQQSHYAFATQLYAGFQQTSLDTNIVYENFDRADGSSLSGVLCTSGNATWGVTGALASYLNVTGRQMGCPGAGSTSGAAYAYLTSPASSPTKFYVDGLVTFTMGSNTSLTALTPLGAIAAAQSVAQLTGTMLHLAPAIDQWALDKRLSGGAFVQIAAGQPAGQLRLGVAYLYGIASDSVAQTATITGPFGPPVTVSDPDIATIAPTTGYWEVQAPDVGTPYNAWSSARIGASVANRIMMAANGVDAQEAAYLRGSYANKRGQVPLTTIPSGGSAGFVRVATVDVLALLVANAELKVSASTTVGNQIIRFKVLGGVAGPQVFVESNDAPQTIFNLIRLTTDGSTVLGIDLQTAQTTYAVSFQVDTLGLVVPALPGTTTVGATSLGTDYTCGLPSGLSVAQGRASVAAGANFDIPLNGGGGEILVTASSGVGWSTTRVVYIYIGGLLFIGTPEVAAGGSNPVTLSDASNKLQVAVGGGVTGGAVINWTNRQLPLS